LAGIFRSTALNACAFESIENAIEPWARPSRASIPYQQTRRPLRHAHGTWVTVEVEAAAVPITLPFAGAAVVCDVSINPIVATAIAARMILRIVISSI